MHHMTSGKSETHRKLPLCADPTPTHKIMTKTKYYPKEESHVKVWGEGIVNTASVAILDI